MSEEQEQQATPVEQQSNDQVNALQRSIEALERKNHELIGKLQKAKKVPDGIDVDELIQFKRQAEQAELELSLIHI